MFPKYDFEVAAITNKGKKKAQNEDAVLANTGEHQAGKFGLFVVADGVGGSDRGKEASLTAIDEMNTWWDYHLPVLLTQGKTIDEIATDLRLEAELINLKIFEEGQRTESSMATTFSALLLINDQSRLIHIGDSRIYRMRKNRIKMLTEDHTWIAEQVKKGLLREEEAQKHKNRHAITRCLGHKESCEFFRNGTPLKNEDLFLLCSDGFYNYYSEDGLLNALHPREKMDMTYYELLNKMVDRIYDMGAHDNISAITVKIRKNGIGRRWFR